MEDQQASAETDPEQKPTAPEKPATPTPLTPEQEALREQAIEALKTVFDPEIPVNIYELGMIYNIDVLPDDVVGIRMTLTSPMCPVAGTLPEEARLKVAGVDGVKEATVDLVWDPPWNPTMMSEAARVQLNL